MRSSGAVDGRLLRSFGVDRGAGAVLAVCLVAVTLAATAAAFAWVGAVVARQRADAAADLAALAAAAEAMRGGDGCAAAQRVAAAMSARAVSCQVGPDGTADVLTEVDLPSRLLRRLDLPDARGRARAGPSR